MTNEGSCTQENLTTSPSSVVVGGTRISFSVVCTGNRQYAERVTGKVQYPGTDTKTTVVQWEQLANSNGTNTMHKHLDVPSISVACVDIDGQERCVPA